MSIEVRDLWRRVGEEAWLADINLTLEPGRLYVLLGRTHAGKTSLLRLLAGLDRPSEGRIAEDGADLTRVAVNRRNVAFVYQQFVNYPSFTVYDNIAAPLRRKGVKRDEIDGKVRKAAETVRITPFLDRLPGQLSGGQQQRVAIARALVKEAPLLLLDEPLVNLDYKLREELRTELRSIFRAGNQAVVYSTTEPDEALQMGGETIVMHEGRILQKGPTEAVYRAPASVDVAHIFSEPPMNVARARLERGRLTIGDLEIAAPGHFADRLTGECRIGLPPHRLTQRRSEGGLPLLGRILLAEVDGFSTFTHFAAAGENWIAQVEGVDPQPLGADFRAFLDPDDLYLFDAGGALVVAPPRAARMS